MLRKVAGLCLLILYLTSTSGFAVNLHYCGTKVSQVTVNTTAKSCCKKEALKPMKCCHDKNLKIKVSDKHKPVNEPVKSQPTGFDIFLEAVDYFGPFNLLRPKSDVASYRGPPSSRNASTTVLNCNYRI
jgi:hypothetical protein